MSVVSSLMTAPECLSHKVSCSTLVYGSVRVPALFLIPSCVHNSTSHVTLARYFRHLSRGLLLETTNVRSFLTWLTKYCFIFCFRLEPLQGQPDQRRGDSAELQMRLVSLWILQFSRFGAITNSSRYTHIFGQDEPNQR